MINKIKRWLSSLKFILWRFITKFLSYSSLAIISYRSYNRKKIFNLLTQIKKETNFLLDYNEAYQIFVITKNTEKVKGGIVEVGVYNGGSAKIICEAKGNRPLYLFDTFEGLPEVGDHDGLFYKGQFKASFKNVKAYLKKYSNVHFYRGLFPATAKPIKNKSFSFVNLDVDIYKSALDCLEFFYPRMNKGGVILSHDYTTVAGIRKAFDEFFKDKPEPLIELSNSQCLIIKI